MKTTKCPSLPLLALLAVLPFSSGCMFVVTRTVAKSPDNPRCFSSVAADWRFITHSGKHMPLGPVYGAMDLPFSLFLDTLASGPDVLFDLSQ